MNQQQLGKKRGGGCCKEKRNFETGKGKEKLLGAVAGLAQDHPHLTV